jgi:hypothetical protein
VTLAHTTAEGLCRFEQRGPCSDSERRAAGWLHDDLRANGHEAWVETHWVRPQWALSLALHATVGVVTSVVALSAPLPAAIAAALAALSMAVEAVGGTGPLRWLLPRRATQNVLTVPDEEAAEGVAAERGVADRSASDAGAAEMGAAAGSASEAGAAEAAPAVTLLICARYDAPRGGLVTRDGPRRLAARLRRRLGGRGLGPRAWVALALAAVALCAGLRGLGVEGFWLGLAQFVPTVALLGALAAAGDIVVSPVSPGAGDNAAGVGVAVALHQELTRNPPDALAPALLLFGAGEGGPPAVRAHLRRERLDRARVVVLELGPCGAGAPVYATAHPQLRAACERAAEALGGAARAPLRRSSAAGAARGRRLPAAWIGALDADGIAPRSRQPSDTLEHLDPAASEAVLDFALASIDALDAELGRR